VSAAWHGSEHASLLSMPPERTTLGAIDAGSNAIRMVVAELGPSELIRVEAERMPVRLGHGAFTRGELDDAVIDQAVAAFVHFRERFDHHGVMIYRAVGTSAVRNATNRDVLLHRLYHEAGIELEVIDGEEEARLVRKSVVHSLGPTGTPPRAIPRPRRRQPGGQPALRAQLARLLAAGRPRCA